MHCANLDTLVNDLRSVHLSSSPPSATIPVVVAPESMAELAPSPPPQPQSNEDAEILKMVLDIGMFVLEGRLPHRKTKRGYIEGPHCVLQPPQAQPHRCDYTNYLCERAGKYGRLIEAIWNENKTLCIELRICADCRCGEEQVWKNSVSRYDYVLEQWIFDVTNFRNNGDGIGFMNGYGLLQAIRSQIHFSQLSAWWSSNQAQLPKNITYHVIPLTQVDLNSVPLQHTFPVLAFNSTYLQVKVRSQPRSETLPKIHCPVHCNQDNVVDDRMKIYCDRFGKHHCQALDEELLDENVNDTFCDGFVESEALDGLIDEEANRRASGRTTTTTKYGCCPVTDEAPPKLGGPNECALNSKNFSTFLRANSRYFGHSSTKHVPHSSTSSFLEGCCSTAVGDPIERRKPKIDAVLFDLLREASSSALGCKINDNSSSSEMELKRPRVARFSVDAEATTSFRKMDKRTIETTATTAAKTDCQSRVRMNVDDDNDYDRGVNGGRADGCERDRPADLNLARPNKSLTKIVTAIGGGGRDRYSEAGVHFSSSRTVVRKDDNNNSKVVEVRKIGGEGARRNSKFSTKTIVSPKSPKSPKSADKLRATVIKKYFRSRNNAAAKPLLPLFGNVIESVLSGRMYFSQVVDNFKIKITGCVPFGSHSVGTELPAAAYYYHFGDVDLSRSYLVKSSIPDREKGIQISSTGQLQVSVFNTENSLIKVFIVPYDLSDMPRCTKTYVRHSNYYAPADITKYSIQWLQSLIQFKCVCSKSGRLYLQNEINVIMFQKSDLNTACELQQQSELKHHNVTEIAYK